MDELRHEPAHIREHVARVQTRIRQLLGDGQWWSVEVMAQWLRHEGLSMGEPSISACIRNLRKPRYGGLRVLGERQADGVFRYRLEG